MTTPQQQRKSLRALRESTGTLFAQNTTPHKVTCNGDNLSFELEPAGFDDSIRIVPKEALSEPGFQRLWMKGAILISDDEEMENQITLLMGGQVDYVPKAQVQDEDGAWRDVEATIEAAKGNNSFSVATDTDPNSRTYGQALVQKCIFGGEQIFQTQKDIDAGEPPVCPEHQSQIHRVVSTPHADNTWTHQVTSIEAPQKGLS